MPGTSLICRCHRWALVILSALALSAVEPPPPVVVAENGATAIDKIIPILVDWAAGGESSGSPQEGAKNFLKGGEYGPAVVGYEKARITCDTLSFWQDRMPGVKRLVPNRLLVESGPFGLDKQRVILDSRDCRLPKVGFRGLLKPTLITVDRLATDPAAPLAVRFKAVLTRPGDFFGDLRTDQGWEHYAGWAHEIEMILRGDIDPALQELVNLRLETLHLFGRKREGEVPRETAVIMKMKAPFSEGKPVKDIDRGNDSFGGAQAMTISLFFDAQGTMEHGSSHFTGDFQGWGDDNLFGSHKPAPASAPVALPADAKPQP